MDELFYLEGGQFRRLQTVMRALYSPEPLTGDARRDLANIVDAVLDSVERHQQMNKADIGG